MSSSERGAVSIVLGIGVVVIVGALAAGYYFTKQTPNTAQREAMTEETIVTTDETMMEKTVPSLPGTPSEIMMETTPNSTYQAEVLAGTTAPLLKFNQADYDQALAEGKLVVLYFYANWCPTCKAEFPLAQAAFDQLQTNQVVGFQVNFNDNETDDQEEALARQFGVPYQHTKVFVRGGKQVLKSPETWTTQRYITEITENL